MRELSEEEQAILDAIDLQLRRIDKKLRPFQELIDQKTRLTRTKATFLNENVVGRGRGNNSGVTLTHEMVEAAFEKSDDRYMTVAAIAQETGVPDSTVRSHLHRRKDESYKQKGDKWRLIKGESE